MPRHKRQWPSKPLIGVRNSFFAQAKNLGTARNPKKDFLG